MSTKFNTSQTVLIVNIGDGKLTEPNNSLVDIQIPPKFFISYFNDPIQATV